MKPILNQDYFPRPLKTEQDRSFVIATWIKGYQLSPANPFKPNHGLYWHYQHDLIEALLEEADVTLLVGENKDDIYGYAVHQWRAPSFVLHWMHIRTDFRHMGLATNLLNYIKPTSALPKTVATHLSAKFTYVDFEGRGYLHKKAQEDFIYLPAWAFAERNQNQKDI